MDRRDPWPEIPTRRALADWIAGQPVEWTWFVTLTFAGRGTRSAEVAARAWHEWARRLAAATLTSARARRTGQVPWLRTIERHRHRDAVHVHAVVAGVESLDPETFAGLWRLGFVRIRPFRPGHVAYVLKRVDRGADWDASREAFGPARQ